MYSFMQYLYNYFQTAVIKFRFRRIMSILASKMGLIRDEALLASYYRSFPSCSQAHYQSETWCLTLHLKMSLFACE